MANLSVQVPGQLHGGLHLHVVFEEALPKRGLVVGLARLGLDGRLNAGLGHFKLNLISSWLTALSGGSQYGPGHWVRSCVDSEPVSDLDSETQPPEAQDDLAVTVLAGGPELSAQ